MPSGPSSGASVSLPAASRWRWRKPWPADAQLDEWAVLDHLSALVDKSLVVADAGDSPRYRLLESARAFALEQLAAAETAETLKRHALAMRKFLERVDGANLDGELRTDQYAALVLPELDNLRAAHAWAIGEAGDVQVAIALAAHAGALIDYAIECADWLLPHAAHVEDGAASPALAARYWRALAAGNMMRAGATGPARATRHPGPCAVPGAGPAAANVFQSDAARAAPAIAAAAHGRAGRACRSAHADPAVMADRIPYPLLRRESSLARGERRFGRRPGAAARRDQAERDDRRLAPRGDRPEQPDRSAVAGRPDRAGRRRGAAAR